MRVRLGRKLSNEERREMDRIHFRFLVEALRIPSSFAGPDHETLYCSYRGILRNDVEGLARLSKTLKLTEMKDVVSGAWEALIEGKDKWHPHFLPTPLRPITKETLTSPDKVKTYIRTIAWRLQNRLRKSRLRENRILFDFSDDVEVSHGSDSCDIQRLKLLITIRQIIEKAPRIQPDRKQDMLALIIARFFGYTRADAHEHLGWSKSRVQAVWKDIERQGILPKLKKEISSQ